MDRNKSMNVIIIAPTGLTSWIGLHFCPSALVSGVYIPMSGGRVVAKHTYTTTGVAKGAQGAIPPLIGE